MARPDGFHAIHTSKDGVHIWLLDGDGRLYETERISHQEYSAWEDITPPDVSRETTRPAPP